VGRWRPIRLAIQGFSQLYDKLDITVEAIAGEMPAIHTDSPLLTATCGTVYSQQLAGCGEGTQTWSLISGSLPRGLSMDSNGLVSGTPYGSGAGSSTFTVQMVDSVDGTVTKELQIPITGNCCNDPPADLDGDGDVDQTDFALLHTCMTGTGGGVPASCTCADLNVDQSSVDQADLAVFEGCASGAGVPASPSCQ
jgi:hypothetical protein